ncbi:MAG TPA: Crp/Fnr family transcriptional regulator [Candidatus Dormibacteraeota bacterium]|nr:Crp/Fnr family transcriptional regulator [Candidatus Dormibacteraeota bacterium]
MEASRLAREGVDFLSLLSEVNRRRLLEHSTRAVLPAGTVAFNPEGPPRAFLLERGLTRAYWSVPDGRQATVAFNRRNELIGGTVIMHHPPWTFVQAVVESTVTILDVKTVRDLAAREMEVITAIATHLAARVQNDLRLIAVRSLGNLRERVAYDLLERACRSQLVVGRLEVRATQGQLADSIGFSREVVSRALGGLRAAGIVETAPGVVRVVNPIRLAAIVRAIVI